MSTHVISLIGLVALCVFRAVFQLWLKKTDPDVAEQSNECGGCNSLRAYCHPTLRKLQRDFRALSSAGTKRTSL